MYSALPVPLVPEDLSVFAYAFQKAVLRPASGRGCPGASLWAVPLRLQRRRGELRDAVQPGREERVAVEGLAHAQIELLAIEPNEK